MTLTERRILANQYRILSALTKDKYERETFEEKIEALESGYELHFDDQNLTKDEDVMSVEECREVLDILGMYDDLHFSFKVTDRGSPLAQSLDADLLSPAEVGGLKLPSSCPVAPPTVLRPAA